MKERDLYPFITETLIIQTNGVRLHVQASGPPDGPLVILLHGFPEFWYGWRHQISALAQAGYYVIVPDQRGYNLSERPGSLAAYDLDELARDVIGLIDHFGRQNIHLVGHDWGAAVAWHTAIHHPGRVERLCILNVPHPAAHARAFRRLDLRQLIKSWYIAFFQLPALPEVLLGIGRCAALRRMLRNTSKPGSFTHQDLARYVEAWQRPRPFLGQAGPITGMLNWYRAVARSVFNQTGQGYLAGRRSRISMPVLILWGDRDVALIRELADWSLEWCDNGRLVHFPQATHWVQHDEPAEVNARLIAFLAETPAE